jgi:diguanylate cyclase (GGDEF)-like protein
MMQEEQQKIKETIISQLSEDEVNSQYLVEQIEKISTPELQDSFYSNLIDLFVHLSIKEEEAKMHWENILKHYDQICSTLERDVGLRLAIFDYFINLNKSLKSPLLVEIRLFKEAEQLAMYDFLTGLFNRRYFDMYLNKELRRATRHDKDFSLFLLDLDDFKIINDTYGHLFGDEVLKKFASFLKYMSREEDVICRFGGEEFIIILPETTTAGALGYADRVLAAMREDAFFKQHKVTFSGGIATYKYGGTSALQLIANADEALYDAKLAGKDQVLTSKVENRKLFRYTKNWQTYLQPMGHQKSGKNPTPCVTQNISLNGLSVASEENYKIGDRILLTIELPTNDKIVIVGEIIWASKKVEAERIYGIKYVDLSQEQQKHLEKFLPRDKSNKFPPF